MELEKAVMRREEVDLDLLQQMRIIGVEMGDYMMDA